MSKQIQCMICGLPCSSEMAPEFVLRAFTCCVECFDTIPIDDREFEAWRNQGVVLRDLRKLVAPAPQSDEGSGT